MRSWLNTGSAVLCFFMLIGVSLIGLGIYRSILQHRFVRESLLTEGIVVGTHQSYAKRDGHTPIMYYPIVQYETEKKEQTTFIGGKGSKSPNYALGRKVPVRYMLGHVNTARLMTVYERWFDIVTLIGCGLITFFIGFLPLRSVLNTRLNRVLPRSQ